MTVESSQLLDQVVMEAGRPYLPPDRTKPVFIELDRETWDKLADWKKRSGKVAELPASEMSHEFNALVWAQQFALVHDEPGEDVMLGWFANAIMAGYDHGRQASPNSIITRTQLEELCEISHDEYERQAAMNGWATQLEIRKPWSDVPEANKSTVRHSLTKVLRAMGLDVL